VHGRWQFLGLALISGACSEPATPSEPQPSHQLLVTIDEWSGVAREQDEFITDPDIVPSCLGAGFFVEDSWLEIDTTVCSWVTIEGAARFAVEEGQELRLVVSHFDLVALEPSQGELRLRLGGCDAWQKSVGIPQPAAVYTEPFASPCSLEAGGAVRFHLHNHGQNNWQLQELTVLR
jgi:hypothetical protein